MKIFIGIIWNGSIVLSIVYYWLGRKNLIKYETQKNEDYYNRAIKCLKWMVVFLIVNIIFIIIYFIEHYLPDIIKLFKYFF